MSYLSQMAGLAVQNFVSAATGIAIAIALVRGFARRSASEIGNFWVDLDAGHALRPAADLRSSCTLFLVARGVPQNLNDYTGATTLGGAAQTIAAGTGRLAGSDQDARHQRRRLLQRQLRPPVREPDAASPTSSRCCSSSRSPPG